MGICVKFSAKALDYYREQTGLEIYQFLQMVQSDKYGLRLSRIDLTADYFNEDIDITKIYQDYTLGKSDLFYAYRKKDTGKIAYRRNHLKDNGIANDNEFSTIYFGSVQSHSRLRIYDKKREQIERSGNKLQQAKNCNDWVRFEGVFRRTYAHQLTEQLLNINNNTEFAGLIANTMLQKFNFKYVNDKGEITGNTEYTQRLCDHIASHALILSSPCTKNYELFKSMVYLICSSGADSTLKKIKAIWNDKAVLEFLNFIKRYSDETLPNDDCRSWLYHNVKDYQRNYPDFDKFFRENIYPLLP